MIGGIRVQTQGISADWSRADGSYATLDRGSWDHDGLVALLDRLRFLADPDPDSPDGADCPPHVVTEAPPGRFSFVMEAGAIYCHETTCLITVSEAVALAAGQQSVDEVAGPREDWGDTD